VDLYFVRHATAENKTSWSEGDASRPLSSTGRDRFARAAHSLATAGALTPELILTSPLVRAAQTAEILRAALADSAPVEVDERLGTSFDLQALRGLLSDHEDRRAIAIVGHNPSFGAVISALVGGGDIVVRKGAVALVEVTGSAPLSGRLLWIAPPALFASEEPAAD
jgi:phosphohistidine phosphatase